MKQLRSWMMSSLFLAFFWHFHELCKAANLVLVIYLRFVLLERHEVSFSFAVLFSLLELSLCSFRRILHFFLFSFVSSSPSDSRNLSAVVLPMTGRLKYARYEHEV